jgi:membrane dipeptidase
LSAIGRELVQGMDALGVVHDLSHLSWRGMDELFEATDALVIASHSNCSALLERGDREPNQRHLLDAHIREIGRRGGVVGLNLVKFFIKAGIDPKDPADRPTADDAAAHVEHVAQIMGHRRGVGLGSDLDGGITRDDIPAGIDSHEEMGVICDALRRRGWSDAEVRGFAWENWARVLKIPAP